MAVETRVEVLAVDAARVEVRALAACGGCGGCAGRCGLGFSVGRSVSLSREEFSGPVEPGAMLRLTCEARLLRDRAALGYGLPLLLLLAGAGVGAMLSALAPGYMNAMVGMGAAAGTLLGLNVSKRAIQRAGTVRVIDVHPDTVPALDASAARPLA